MNDFKDGVDHTLKTAGLFRALRNVTRSRPRQYVDELMLELALRRLDRSGLLSTMEAEALRAPLDESYDAFVRNRVLPNMKAEPIRKTFAGRMSIEEDASPLVQEILGDKRTIRPAINMVNRAIGVAENMPGVPRFPSTKVRDFLWEGTPDTDWVPDNLEELVTDAYNQMKLPSHIKPGQEAQVVRDVVGRLPSIAKRMQAKYGSVQQRAKYEIFKARRGNNPLVERVKDVWSLPANTAEAYRAFNVDPELIDEGFIQQELALEELRQSLTNAGLAALLAGTAGGAGYAATREDDSLF